MSCGGVAKTLAQTIDRPLGDSVRERLQEAVLQEPDGPDDDDLAHYTAWWAAQDRVDRAIEGAQDLLALVRTAEKFKISAGRPQYVHWTVAIASLLEFWTHDLGREVTISAHASDHLRGQAKPAGAVRLSVHAIARRGDKRAGLPHDPEEIARSESRKLKDDAVDSPKGWH